ncbi:tyrosine-type recombinase/integrase [Dysosmobacter welbionis]|uniref:tyrosine-type recombinase/integrase n=1 Tax=Dysosmobacter welbionis TaxID=2093857 RepID=UPI00397C43F1
MFRTRTGRPPDRSNIWHEMKTLCREAGVMPEKVFPHNLRHLFAKCFYEQEKDLAHLADLLGHSSIETTRIYVAVSARAHEQILEKMRLIV